MWSHSEALMGTAVLLESPLPPAASKSVYIHLAGPECTATGVEDFWELEASLYDVCSFPPSVLCFCNSGQPVAGWIWRQIPWGEISLLSEGDMTNMTSLSVSSCTITFL
ncbi:uncharacterized protein LJ206_011336 isoform 1-T1 [Theristicus caerulescens]